MEKPSHAEDLEVKKRVEELIDAAYTARDVYIGKCRAMPTLGKNIAFIKQDDGTWNIYATDEIGHGTPITSIAPDAVTGSNGVSGDPIVDIGPLLEHCSEEEYRNLFLFSRIPMTGIGPITAVVSDPQPDSVSPDMGGLFVGDVVTGSPYGGLDTSNLGLIAQIAVSHMQKIDTLSNARLVHKDGEPPVFVALRSIGKRERILSGKTPMFHLAGHPSLGGQAAAAALAEKVATAIMADRVEAKKVFGAVVRLEDIRMMLGLGRT
jgi:hypothetical protein